MSAIATREFIRHCLVPSAYMACHNTLHFSRKTYYWISKPSKQYRLEDSKKMFVCEQSNAYIDLKKNFAFRYFDAKSCLKSLLGKTVLAAILNTI